MSEFTWSVHIGEEETEGSHCSHNFSTRGRGEAGTGLLSGVTVTGLREWPGVVSGAV